MADFTIIGWLTIASNIALALAALSFVALIATKLKRFNTVKIGWAGKTILLLLIADVLLHMTPEAAAQGWHKAGRMIGASLILMTIGGFAWPFFRQFKQQFLGAAKHDTEAATPGSRHWLRQAQKIAHVGHWHYNVPEDRLIWSDEIYQIHGFCDPISSTGPTPNIISMTKSYHPDDQAIVTRCFQNAIISQQDFEISVRLIRISCELRHVLVRGVVETDDKGHTSSIFGVLMDITSQKMIELELKNANAASELINKSLREMAMHDSLTGLPNRRLFDSTLITEFKRAAREKTTLGLIMVDLDQFKAYNDRYGHPAGDECLRKVAEAIAGVLQRPADIAARYGGEEMAILLPNTNLLGTETVAKFVLKAVRDLRILHESNQNRIVTISCGIATFMPGTDPHVPVMLVERADKALYHAKHSGRNQVKSYNASMNVESIN